MKKINVSIIIVYFKAKKEFFGCLKSIYKSEQSLNFEIIVVDCEEESIIGKELLKKFPKVIYIKSRKNLGYGAGNNLGAKHAKGEYLFFLNPDTKILDNTLDELSKSLKRKKNIGLVSPILLDKNNKHHYVQGSQFPTPLRVILSLSFIHKLFPNNIIARKFFLEGWNRKNPEKVDVLPGTAFLIKRNTFEKIDGFDERYFLFYEEADLAQKINKIGLENYIIPTSKLIHLEGISTKTRNDIGEIYQNSQYDYFKKWYGLPSAILVKLFTGLNKYHLIISLIVILGFFLRIYKLNENMSFIGDQGWFYLSARDMFLTGKIPLAGITSSHTWLHQGPLWTYMLSIPLAIFKFNPVSGGYLTAILGTITVVLIYRIGSKLFSLKSGVIASLLYAVSPLVIAFDRMPYHTSPIALFTVIYFYAVFKWINGKANYFPVTILLIAILYNLELATFILFFPFALLFAYGLLRRKTWTMNVFDKKIIIYSLISFVIPMLPVIIYDFSNGFKQTIIFFGWTLYKPFSYFIYHSSSNFLSNTSILMNFIFECIRKLVFPSSLFISIVIFLLSILLLIRKVVVREKLIIESSTFLLIFLLTFSLVGIFISQTPSDAYLPIIFPFVIFAVALLFDFLFKIKQIGYFFIIFFILMISLNVVEVVQREMSSGFKNKIQAVDEIISLTKNKKYNLLSKGAGSQFKSFTMNYEYLLWWKGYPPSHKQERFKIIISESSNGIKVEKEMK